MQVFYSISVIPDLKLLSPAVVELTAVSVSYLFLIYHVYHWDVAGVWLYDK